MWWTIFGMCWGRVSSGEGERIGRALYCAGWGPFQEVSERSGFFGDSNAHL